MSYVVQFTPRPWGTLYYVIYVYSVRVCISLYVLYLDYDSRMVIPGQLIVTCSGNQQYSVREKPTVILYTYV